MPGLPTMICPSWASRPSPSPGLDGQGVVGQLPWLALARRERRIGRLDLNDLRILGHRVVDDARPVDPFPVARAVADGARRAVPARGCPCRSHTCRRRRWSSWARARARVVPERVWMPARVVVVSARICLGGRGGRSRADENHRRRQSGCSCRPHELQSSR